MTQTVAHPLGVRALPAGTHPCAVCGIPSTAPPDLVEERHYVPATDVLGAGVRVDEMPGPFNICEACTARQAAASAIVAAHPSLRRLGSRGILTDWLTAALTVFAAMGQPMPDEWTATMTADAMVRLGTVGYWFRWSAQKPDPLTCASEPWLWVDSDGLDAARSGLAEWLTDRRDPHLIACSTGGCAACGVSASVGRRLREAWEPVTSGPLRGGHLCTVCAPEFESNVPLTVFIDRAVFAHLDPDRAYRRRGPTPPRLSGVRAWADTGRAPNRRPWGHVDLSQPLRALQGGTW